jgi:hypothetical protein
MDDDLGKVAGQINPAPSPEEDADARKLQAARRAKMEDRTRQAVQHLKELMKTKEMQRIGWAMQFSYRLLQWAQMEASCVTGMSEMTLLLLMQIQERDSQQTGFDFEKLVKDFKGHQLHWIEERMREDKARRVSHDRRIKQLTQRLRRQDIPLPFHSLRRLFDEKGFTHEDSLSLIGRTRGLELVLRLIALDYQRAGGTVLFLTSSSKREPERIAKISMPAVHWINSCQIFARLRETLDPHVKAAKVPPGLIVVENLDRALANSELGIDRPSRLQRAFAMLKQYQHDRGVAFVVGIHTDEDPEGVDPMQVYPPLILSCPFTQVKLAQSELVDWSENVCIGNDAITLGELKKKISE